MTIDTYQFVLGLDNVDKNTPNLEDKLFEANCGDAVINFRNEKVYLDFDRKAPSFDEAIENAINDLQSFGFRISQSAICELVAKYFKGDIKKTALWFEMKNTGLGGLSPRDMIHYGRFKKLKEFIHG